MISVRTNSLLSSELVENDDGYLYRFDLRDLPAESITVEIRGSLLAVSAGRIAREIVLNRPFSLDLAHACVEGRTLLVYLPKPRRRSYLAVARNRAGTVGPWAGTDDVEECDLD